MSTNGVILIGKWHFHGCLPSSPSVMIQKWRHCNLVLQEMYSTTVTNSFLVGIMPLSTLMNRFPEGVCITFGILHGSLLLMICLKFYFSCEGTRLCKYWFLFCLQQKLCCQNSHHKIHIWKWRWLTFLKLDGVQWGMGVNLETVLVIIRNFRMTPLFQLLMKIVLCIVNNSLLEGKGIVACTSCTKHSLRCTLTTMYLDWSWSHTFIDVIWIESLRSGLNFEARKSWENITSEKSRS